MTAMTKAEYEILYNDGLFAAAVYHPFDFRKPKPWQAGWMDMSQVQVIQTIMTTMQLAPIFRPNGQ